MANEWSELPEAWLLNAASEMHKLCLKEWRDFKKASKTKLAA